MKKQFAYEKIVFLKKLKEEPDKEAYKPFIENLKKYVVYKSVAIGVEEMGKLPTERGLIWETISMTITNPKVEQRAETEKTKTTYDKYAEAYISEVIRYLNEHCEEYPEYMEYTNGKNAVTNRYKRDNRNKKILKV